MQKIFFDTQVLDKKCRDEYGLSEELMMENAAAALEDAVLPHARNLCGHYLARPVVMILCGKGNNGADGYALARRLSSHEISVVVCELDSPATEIGKLQRCRAEKTGAVFITPYDVDYIIEEKSFDLTVIVDCIFGSGFRLPLDSISAAVIESCNSCDSYRIACDVPSGLDSYGNCGNTVFNADETVTMGALKLSLFSDSAKDLCGKISVGNLGVARSTFEMANFNEEMYVLEREDMKLPFRNRQNVNKGSFGHLAVLSGEKSGASVIAGLAALNFGAGLVTLVGTDSSNECELMCSMEFPQNTTAVSMGMGLGRSNPKVPSYFDYINENKIPGIFDADIFYYPEFKDFLNERVSQKIPTVLTPHPKEFAQLLKVCGFGDYEVSDVVKERIQLAKGFCRKFPGAVLLLKGANSVLCVMLDTIKLFVNPMGSSALSKAGSGDVLSGLIGALLAQRFTPLNSAMTSSIVHAVASNSIVPNFSLTPKKLIEAINEVC